MLMVVFGAGASYDSAPSQPPLGKAIDPVRQHRLPLADELFEDRELFAAVLERFRHAQPVVPWLRHLESGSSVERVLERLQAEADHDPRRHQQLAAVRYYIQSVIGECQSSWDRTAAHGVTNYKSLLDLIEHSRKPNEPVCLVTFNYDTMLETALPTVGVEIRSIGDYVKGANYRVVKLHGSVSWGREVDPPVDNVAAVNDERLVIEMIERAASLKVSDRYYLANQRPVVRLNPQQPLFPAIAIPLERKKSYECPAAHLEALVQCIPSVHRLLVIGWRATDTPFLQLLREHGRQNLHGVVVAGGPRRAQEVINHLKKNLNRPGEFFSSKGGFTDFIVGNEAAEFLQS